MPLIWPKNVLFRNLFINNRARWRTVRQNSPQKIYHYFTIISFHKNTRRHRQVHKGGSDSEYITDSYCVVDVWFHLPPL